VILVAVTVSLVRVVIDVGVVIPEKFPEIVLPFIILYFFMVLLSTGLFYTINKGHDTNEVPEHKNPAQFKSALFFLGSLWTHIIGGSLYQRIVLGKRFEYCFHHWWFGK
jgi:low temperature requirement protein LtrA